VYNLDEQLNKHLLKILVNFFLLLGFAAFLSICVALIGLLYLSGTNNFLEYKSKYSDTVALPSIAMSSNANTFEFAGYSTWDEFASNCCCLGTSNGSGDNATMVETWKCIPKEGTTKNNRFMYKQRLRVDPKLGNGLQLREYCSPIFNPLVVCKQPYFDDAKNMYVVGACDGSSQSSDALSYLW
jgi:hypothetical protein